ncbi:MAG: energy transducer TonB [Blastocatellales bacterium]|nr:energy transducer TonB [Blastocatellales bacterium]
MKMPRKNLSSNRRSVFFLIVSQALFLCLVNPVSYSQDQLKAKKSLKDWHCVRGKEFARDSKGQAIWLGTDDMMGLVIDKSPLKLPLLLGKNNLQGIVNIDVLIGENGKVKCIRAVKGHPFAISSAIDAVPNWKFKPYTVDGVPSGVLGEMEIPYDFRR